MSLEKINLFVHCNKRKLERFGLELLIRLRFLKYIAATLHLIENIVIFYVCRAVGCIFGELLNNSPLFPVSITTKISL